MDARLVQCMSIAGFIEDIRLSLGKIDNHSDRLPDQPLNLIDDAALKFAAVDSFADCSHLFRGLTHGDKKYVFVLWRKGHRRKNNPADLGCFGRMRACLAIFELCFKRGHQTVNGNDSLLRRPSFEGWNHYEGAVGFCRILIMLCLPARLGFESGKIPVFSFNDKLPAIGRVNYKIGSEPGYGLLRYKFNSSGAKLFGNQLFNFVLLSFWHVNIYLIAKEQFEFAGCAIDLQMHKLQKFPAEDANEVGVVLLVLFCQRRNTHAFNNFNELTVFSDRILCPKDKLCLVAANCTVTVNSMNFFHAEHRQAQTIGHFNVDHRAKCASVY